MGGAFTTTDGCMKHIDGGAKKVIISAPAKDAMDHPEFGIKHINSPMSPEYMKYLLEHDTVHGRFDGTVEVTDKGLTVNGLPITLSPRTSSGRFAPPFSTRRRASCSRRP